MTKQQEELLRGLKALFKFPVIVEPCTVKSVDEGQLTCVVIPLDGPEIPNVRLKAGIDGIDDGLVTIPEVDSIVLVAMIGNDENTRFIIGYSSVAYSQFNGGENGGLVNWPDAKEELDKVKDLLTSIVNVLNGAPIPEPGNGAASALQTALSGAIAGKQLPTFNDLEDDKVKH